MTSEVIKMNLNYFRKIQNSYRVSSKKEQQLNIINKESEKHWNNIDCEDVVINGENRKLMVVKDTDNNASKRKLNQYIVSHLILEIIYTGITKYGL